MKPGRLVCVHTKDLAVYKNSSGYTGLYDFTGDYHRAMEKSGFRYHSKITIWTDPVLEMQRTKTQRLLYKQLRKDSTFTGVGLPEYLTIFKKWEDLEDGNKYPVNNKTYDNFPLDTWQNWASPIWGEKIPKHDLIELIKFYADQNGVDYDKLTPEAAIKPEWLSGSWFDIKRTDVLNNKEGTDTGDEKHIAPLQLTVIKRAIQMWTNPGELVFSPFAGIGSELYSALKLNRRAAGVELKPSYYQTALKNINNVLINRNQQVLF
jgi:DNA modification methylase